MIELKNSRTTYLGKASGGNRYALDAFIGAVQMLDPYLGWQDIKPRLVRDKDGWHVEGAPYYAEVKDDGSRLFCPDRYQKSKYIRFLPHAMLKGGAVLKSNPSVLDRISIPNELNFQSDFGEFSFLFTNTGMYLPLKLSSAIEIDAKAVDRLTFDIDSNLDVESLLKVKTGFGIVPARLGDELLEWSYKNGQLEFGFDLTGRHFPLEMIDAVDVQVGAGADDGGRSGGATFNNTNNYQTLGYQNTRDGYFRFTGVTIAGTIDVSYVRLYGAGVSGTAELKVYGCDEDDPAAPTTLAEMDADPLTGAGVDWDGAFTGGNWNQSPSLNTVFQELVDSYTISGDAVMLKIKGDNAGNSGYNQCRTYEYGTAYAPGLHIEYTEGGGGAAKTGAETASGAEGSLLQAAVVKAETGAGADAGGDYSAAISASAEGVSGSDISLSLKAELAVTEAGSGSELSDLLKGSTGLVASDSGSGVEAVIGRWLERVVAGSGVDTAVVTAALVRGESGSVTDAAAGTILSGESGAASEIGVLLKTVLCGDGGLGREALKSLVQAAGAVTDMRLPGRAGQGKIPSKRGTAPSRRKKMPSKGVNL